MLSIKNLVKVYDTKGGVNVRALDSVSIDFPETGMVFLLGRSGSGKSTLLNVVGGLDTPTDGEIIVKGRSSKDFTASDFDSYRNTYIGFVFQDYNLLNEFSIEENIAIALRLQNKPNDQEAVENILKLVELGGMGKRKPNTLSGGQKQRVAIARALIKNPEIIMADEPTGALDSNTGKQIFDTLKKLSQTRLVIVVSHDRSFAEEYGDRIIELSDGVIISDKTRTASNGSLEDTNVTVVSDDTITVKDWKKVTEEDIKYIVSTMKAHGGETVITSGKKEVPEIKKILKIDENASGTVFKKTEKVNVKKYDGSEATFIKSRLPFAHALKMAGTNLKYKPIRLLFTILLSVVAFTLFGVMSTLMLYDSAYSVSMAMMNSHYESVALTKEYDAVYENIQIMNNGSQKIATTFDTVLNASFSNNDLDELNHNETGLNFAGVMDFGYYEYTGLSVGEYETNDFVFKNYYLNNGYDNYFAVKSLCGFSDCGEEYLEANGFTSMASKGYYPKTKGEIAISNYVFDLYKNSKAAQGVDPFKYNEPNDIIGKTIYVGNMSLMVTDVINVGEIPEKYSELYNNQSTLDAFAIKELRDEFKDLIKYSFYTVGFVAEDFYEEHRYDYVKIGYDTMFKTLIGKTEIEKNNAIAENALVDVYTPRSTSTYNYAMKFLDLKGNVATSNIASDKAYLSVKTIIDDNLDTFKKKIENTNISNKLEEALEKYTSKRCSVDDFVTIYTEMVNKLGNELSVQKCYYINKAGRDGELKVAGVFILPRAVSNFGPEAKYYISNSVCDTIGMPPPSSNLTGAREVDNYKSYHTVDAEHEKYSLVLTRTGNQKEQTMFMLKGRDNGVHYAIENNLYDEAHAIAETFSNMKVAFLIASLVMGVFAALMLLNFISVSIENKKNEIGILRAVGARGLDVFKIFITEALMITAICFILSTFTSMFACLIINNIAVQSFIKINFLNFRFINVVFILVVSIIIAILGTVFPVVKAAKRSPVESIRAI